MGGFCNRVLVCTGSEVCSFDKPLASLKSCKLPLTATSGCIVLECTSMARFIYCLFPGLRTALVACSMNEATCTVLLQSSATCLHCMIETGYWGSIAGFGNPFQSVSECAPTCCYGTLTRKCVHTLFHYPPSDYPWMLLHVHGWETCCSRLR